MNILILSVTSDIGLYLAKKYHAEGHSIYGTYRSRANIERIKRDIPGIRLVYCDFEDGNCIDRAAEDIMSESSLWDILISCPCTPKPLKPFMESDIDEWEDSFYLNSLGQLRFLHRVYEKRNIRVTHRKPMALFLLVVEQMVQLIHFQRIHQPRFMQSRCSNYWHMRIKLQNTQL